MFWFFGLFLFFKVGIEENHLIYLFISCFYCFLFGFHHWIARSFEWAQVSDSSNAEFSISSWGTFMECFCSLSALYCEALSNISTVIGSIWGERIHTNCRIYPSSSCLLFKSFINTRGPVSLETEHAVHFFSQILPLCYIYLHTHILVHLCIICWKNMVSELGGGAQQGPCNYLWLFLHWTLRPFVFLRSPVLSFSECKNWPHLTFPMFSLWWFTLCCSLSMFHLH